MKNNFSWVKISFSWEGTIALLHLIGDAAVDFFFDISLWSVFRMFTTPTCGARNLSMMSLVSFFIILFCGGLGEVMSAVWQTIHCGS